MRKEVTALLQSNLTSYKIAKDTGIPVQQLDRYRKSTKIENITFGNVEKIYDYYIKIKNDINYQEK